MSVPGLAAPALAGLGARAARLAALAALGLLLLVLLAVLAVFGSEYERRHPGVQESPGSGIPPVYLPVYAAAEHAYGVNRWLLASIHLQESDFSRLRAPLAGRRRGVVGLERLRGGRADADGDRRRRALRRDDGRRLQRRADVGGVPARVRARRRRAARALPAAARRASRVRARARARRLRVRRLRRDPRRGAEAARRRRDAATSTRPARGARCARTSARCLAADTYYGVLPRAKAWEAAALAARPLRRPGGVGAAGLIWPVRGPVVSPYGMRWGAMHEGIDIAAPTGTPILAAQDGQVVLRQWFGGYGQFTCLRHAVELTTCYGHQSRALVRMGERVGAGSGSGSSAAPGTASGRTCTSRSTWPGRGARTSATSTR